LAPFLAELLEANSAARWDYVEPYAGGAGVAMELLIDNKVRRVFLNDSSYPIFALWKSIVTYPDEFCRMISRASLSLRSWERHREVLRQPQAHSLLDVGFSTFFLNRCNRSGVLTAGVIGGKAQSGKWRIDARFPRNELVSRVELIARHRDRIVVSNLDAEEFLLTKVNRMSPNTLVYCDPPYYERAKRLYLNTYQPEDHVRLSDVIQTRVRRHWIVSYDGHPDILALYRCRRKFEYRLQYSAMNSYAGSEVFVFSDDLCIPRMSKIAYIHDALTTQRTKLRNRSLASRRLTRGST